MSALSTITTTGTYTTRSAFLAETFKEVVSYTSTTTNTRTQLATFPTGQAFVVESITVQHLVDAPYTCDNILEYEYNKDITANPDIAGIGILLAFFITACFVVILALTAYIGGFLPGHFLRRVDRQIFRANSRNENSRWREIIESVVLSLSDQQLVTGLAILIAGYYEMLNNDLSSYHWRIVVYLAWLSSSVHIASLTLLRDVLNRNPTLRNIRVGGMLILVVLLAVASWPTRLPWEWIRPGVPARCLWRSEITVPGYDGHPARVTPIDSNWTITVIMLLIAYIWKLSQLFASSRGSVRRWLVAKPTAAMERCMRRVALNQSPGWLRRVTHRTLVVFYLVFVTYTEFAESFAASVIYLCLALPYGMTLVLSNRSSVDHGVTTGELRLTFGQLVPLFLLVLPILQVFELSLDSNKMTKKTEKPGAIYSLMMNGTLQSRKAKFPDLTTALRLNEPSNPKHKMLTDSASSHDPIVDHLMSSRAFRGVVWGFFAAVVCIGLVVVFVNLGVGEGDLRALVILVGALPIFVLLVPFATLLVMPFSRRLK